MFGADLGVILIWSALIMLIFMIVWVLLVPLKLFNKIFVNIVLGIACIFIYNLIASFVKFDVIGINELSLSILAVLGVPGFIAIVIVKVLI
jgi:inhibitor of the pro-sigma K processing machinery